MDGQGMSSFLYELRKLIGVTVYRRLPLLESDEEVQDLLHRRYDEWHARLVTIVNEKDKRIAELESDKRRLEWLCTCRRSIYKFEDGWALDDEGGYFDEEMLYQTFRDAIDAAMESE